MLTSNKLQNFLITAIPQTKEGNTNNGYYSQYSNDHKCCNSDNASDLPVENSLQSNTIYYNTYYNWVSFISPVRAVGRNCNQGYGKVVFRYVEMNIPAREYTTFCHIYYYDSEDRQCWGLASAGHSNFYVI